MRDIRQCSGPWKGLWVQGMVRGAMKFALTFEDCKVSGAGEDHDGSFTLEGFYEVQSDHLTLIKHYRGLFVIYKGTWNGQFVSGNSQIGIFWTGQSGTFEIWPEDEEVGFQELESSQSDLARA